MDRRDFFKRGLGQITKGVVDYAEAKITDRASRWIRPPFAQNEMDFLLACSRCDKCIEACPHDVIFPLSAKNGADVMNTPALDLQHKGCHLCADWPCVNACEDNALQLPTVEDNDAEEHFTQKLKLAYVAIDTKTCLPYQGPECGACSSSCPVEGALLWDRERPLINAEKCTGCALCLEACILEPKAILIKNRQAG